MSCRVLIVDDDPAVVRMLERAIEERHLGVVAGTATDGRSGERAALALQPEIVLLDLLMPVQDGLETMRRLKRQGFGGAYVMLSQVTAKELVASAYQLGAEYFVHKPLHLPEVEAILSRVSTSLQLRSTLQLIQACLAPLEPLAESQAAPGGDALRRRTRSLLADLGILGTAGAHDLALLPSLPRFRALRHGRYELSQVYGMLADHCQPQPTGSRELGPKAVEQRIRRAAATALTHLAALGLEDYSDPRFERLAPTFFEFTEMRAEMARLRTGKGATGRVNLKKFLDAFLQALEEVGD